ncbi:MAG: mechanosensitive ion channel [Ignavibacteriales bacterium]|nr:mechanosensitive ion channel [Ignavibacteriales bacterium]
MTFSEVWQKFNEVIHYPLFSINQTQITLLSTIIFIFVITGFILLAKLLRRKVLKKILSKMNIAEGMRFALIRIINYIVLFIGLIISLQFIGIDLSGLAVVLGFLSVGIGFGLQNITSNFISGLILLFERPIQVGDRVTIGDTEGDVTDIKIRSTTIKTLNNISIIVPNSEFISGRVTNWSHGDKKVLLRLNVGVSYNSNLETVIKALKEVANENPYVLKSENISVRLSEFGASEWNMVLLCWLDDPKIYYQVESELNCAIVEKFRKYGIEIPFPQRDLHIKSGIPINFENKTN